MQHLVPSTLVNVALLREKALDLTQTSLNQPVTLRERVVIAILINRELSDPDTPLLEVVRGDLLTLEIPKFTALACWLAPYSLVSTYPNAIIAVARYLLGFTREQVEASVDWAAVRRQFPQL